MDKRGYPPDKIDIQPIVAALPAGVLDPKASYATATDVATAVAAEASDRTNALTSAINAEIAARDSAITDAVAAEAGARDGQVQGAVGPALLAHPLLFVAGATLSSGTNAISASGVAASDLAIAGYAEPIGTIGVGLKAVCTTDTVTVTSILANSATQVLDTSTIVVAVFKR